MSGVSFLAPVVGIVAACAALVVSRATWYRRRVATCARPRPSPPRALTAEERQVVLDTANSDRFVDVSPAVIVATLLEEGVYLCATRTMYRILAAEGEVRERRDQLRHPAYNKPQLLATGPNQVWSWDITKLLSVEKWKYFFLYVIIDVFSRCVVGWLLAEHENATHAKRLIGETCAKLDIEEGTLTIHSDRGSPMTSKTLAQLLADLEITQSHSRPRVSNDNPFSESQFKTLKYRPDFPGRFGNFLEALEYCRHLFSWYNTEHRHSGIAYCSPADVHFGRAAEVLARRQVALDTAYAAHPDRFVHRPPRAQELPSAVWINPPKPDAAPPEASTPVVAQAELQPAAAADAPVAATEGPADPAALTGKHATAMSAPPKPLQAELRETAMQPGLPNDVSGPTDACPTMQRPGPRAANGTDSRPHGETSVRPPTCPEHAQHAPGGLGRSPSSAPGRPQSEAHATLGDTDASEATGPPSPPSPPPGRRWSESETSHDAEDLIGANPPAPALPGARRCYTK